MNIFLNNISEIKIGFPGLPETTGNLQFLQLRHFNEDGILNGPIDEYLKLDYKTESHVLKSGDVLLAAKGIRLFAWCYNDDSIPSVASSSFFVLRPDKQKIHPEYLVAFLNAPQTKTALLQLGAGTNIFSIRKSELGAFQVPLLPINKQKNIAALANLHQKEIQLSKQLIQQKQIVYAAIISKNIK